MVEGSAGVVGDLLYDFVVLRGGGGEVVAEEGLGEDEEGFDFDAEGYGEGSCGGGGGGHGGGCDCCFVEEISMCGVFFEYSYRARLVWNEKRMVCMI